MYEPLSDYVLIHPIPAEDITKGGVVIPDSAKEKPRIGLIVSVGPGRVLDNGEVLQMQLHVGDKVMYAKYGGVEIRIDCIEYLIMREADILLREVQVN